MTKNTRHHSFFNENGWSLFSSSQTDNRLALCKRALCCTRKLTIKLKDCYASDAVAQKYCKMKFTSVDSFDENAKELSQLAWGGRFRTPVKALEGGFYPFVRCIQRTRPIDAGIIWIGTRYEYPRVYVDNLVAHWLCPYTPTGSVMVLPFAPLPHVIEGWQRLSDRRQYPSLSLPPVPNL